MTSPFLSGTKIQFAWDSTSIGWLKECPRKYQYSMIEGYRSRGESVHLKFGLLYHAGLEFYDKLRAEGADHENAMREVVSKALYDTWDYGPDGIGGSPWAPDHPAKTRETLIRSIIWYLDHFKNDPAQTAILANGKPAVELSFRMELDWGPLACDQIVGYQDRSKQPYILCGHLDRVVNYADQIYVMDRKTTSTTPGGYFFDGFSPDNQMSLYTLAAKVVYQTPVHGVIIDAGQIAVGFTRFVRGFTFRTPDQSDEWLNDLKVWLRTAEGYAENNFWPQNDKACNNYGGCTFRKVCSKSPQVREIFLNSDFEKREWNPLVPR